MTEMHLSHKHCWHTDSHAMFTVAIWPPMMPRICCNCGQREMYREPPPPIPEGHGPFYPRRHDYIMQAEHNNRTDDHSDETRRAQPARLTDT